ncbi:MAG: efflux RND transporter permease subunit, partial [Lachnospiraceae bacterium]|nr:efflux RND transporter permease subunit [Lachnospiraceae bacterium]
VIGIGMMVDNAIVVIEMCFRKRDDGLTFMDAAYEGTRLVINSITGATITTIVVYLPLALMKGLSGQMFKEMGFTIIFAIGSSLISAMTIIPFFFSRFKPVEKKENITNRGLRRFAEVYGKILARILRFKKTMVLVVIAIFAVTIMLYSTQDIELLTSTDEGMVEISMSFRPNLTLEEMDKTVVEMEEFVKNNEYIEKYTTSVTKSSSSASIIAYISKDSKLATDAVVDEWNRQLSNFSPSCEVVCAVTSSQGESMSASAEDEIVLLGEDEEALKAFSEEVYELIRATDGVINVRSSLTETGSKASVKIDPVMATAKGFSAQQLAGLVYHNMNGKKAMDVDLKDGDYEVTVEFPKDRFKTIADIDTMTFTNSSGASVPLTEMAKVTFESTPSTITRKDGKLQCTITATMTKDTSHDVSKIYTEKIDALEFPEGVTRGSSMQDDMMDEELGNLVEAVLIAIFLVFMVMAIQFESLINGMLIMLCIPFALIGSLIFLIIMQVDISMTAIMGVLMLAGIVVNNGIIYVDSTNQMMSNGMEVTDALIETGKSRLRPILMTTLTTILSMVPLAFALAEDSEMMQGMGIVIIGGLIASTILTLTLLPTFYLIVYNIKSRRHPKNKRRLFGLIKPKEMNIAARMDDDPESDDMK